jgi:uncharacterized protein with PIN domain
MGTNVAHFRFYAELNDFLPAAQRGLEIPYRFDGTPAVKDSIEALGVPHTEVDLILVNGRSVPFEHGLHAGDRVSVYPVFESLDISPVARVRKEPLREPRFVLDAHLGKLARLLRLLGFDTVYRNDFEDAEVVAVSRAEGRSILTRDRGLLKHGAVTHGYCVRSTDPEEQIREVLRRFDLHGAMEPFRRCLECNGPVERVEKNEVIDRLEPKTKKYYDEFHRCADCGKIYWQGSHYEQMRELVDALAREGSRRQSPERRNESEES